MQASNRIALLAGGGDLPTRLAERMRDTNKPFIVTFEDTPNWVTSYDHLTVAFERPGQIFRALRERGIKDVVMAGHMSRPSLNPFKFDLTMWGLAARLLPALKSGDDHSLRVILALFENRGYNIHGAHQIAPELLVKKDMQTKTKLTPQDRKDIDRAVNILGALSDADIGQGCVVAAGLCLGVETIQGTDAMLRFVAANKSKKGGVFVKAPKANQDRRVDMPTIGAETIKQVLDAGLNGIALIEDGALVLDRQEVCAAADKAGLFITVLHKDLL